MSTSPTFKVKAKLICVVLHNLGVHVVHLGCSPKTQVVGGESSAEKELKLIKGV